MRAGKHKTLELDADVDVNAHVEFNGSVAGRDEHAHATLAN